MSIKNCEIEIKKKCMYPICRDCHNKKMICFDYNNKYICEECHNVKIYEDISNIDIKNLTYSDQVIRQFILEKSNSINYVKAYIKLISCDDVRLYCNDTFINLLYNDLKCEKKNYHLFVLRNYLK